jgi:hypothetical protein
MRVAGGRAFHPQRFMTWLGTVYSGDVDSEHLLGFDGAQLFLQFADFFFCFLNLFGRFFFLLLCQHSLLSLC